ncbi:GGDEF domain-containing protein [Actinoplanes sp. TFC3]|uniref:GGDEF domain-containing protein n=1 Tax=Actinoplanes sp. TFC3 TaxID=1710355 RepID=UPI000832AA4D|nr:GGDEF domain-containing protein [Actinoplanes sp. TFC3]
MDRRLTRDPVLLALVLLMVVSFGFAPTHVSLKAQVAVFWLLLLAAQAVLMVASGLVARALPATSARGRAGRRLWWHICGGALVFSAGIVVQFATFVWDPVAARGVIGSVPQSISVVLGLVVMVFGLLRYPLGRLQAAEKVRLRIDLAVVMVAATTVGLWIFEVPAGRHDLGWVLRAAITLLIQPGLFLVAIFAIVKIMLGGRSPVSRAASTIFGVAALVEAVAQAAPVTFYTDRSLMPWLLAANVSGSALAAIASRVQEKQIHAGHVSQERRDADRPFSSLPYVAMAGIWAVTLAVLAAQGLTWRSWLLMGGAVLTTALVVLRQVAAFRHIAELLRERDALTQQLTELAYHDALTKLANRGLFLRRLQESTATRDITVYLIDLDDFKPVNDSYGHAAGDQLLVEVARRLQACVRPEDLVARLGGDEFAVLVEDLPAERRVVLAATLTQELHARVLIGGHEVALSASVGMATGRPGEHDPDTLLHEADMAMYAVKSGNRAGLPG